MVKHHKIKAILALSFLALLSYSCVKDNFEQQADEETAVTDSTIVEDLTKLVIPADFNFETEKQVSININDAQNGTKYDVYAFSDEEFDNGPIQVTDENDEIVTITEYVNDELNQLVASGIIINGQLKLAVSVPSYYSKFLLKRNDSGLFDSAIVTINDNSVNYTYTAGVTSKKRSLTSKSERDNAVIVTRLNTNGFYKINTLDGSFSALSRSIPKTTSLISMTIDPVSQTLYGVPIVSKLFKYDLNTEKYTSIAMTHGNSGRMAYNQSDGFLYTSNNNKIYKFDPDTGSKLSTKYVNSGPLYYGNIAFAEDGTFLMLVKDALYTLAADEDGNYDPTLVTTLPEEISKVYFNTMCISNDNPDNI